MVETRRTSRRLEAKAAADAINSSPRPSTSSKSTRTFRRTPSPSTRAKKEKKNLLQEKNEKEQAGNEKLERQEIIGTEDESIARADGEDNDKDMILLDKTDEKEEERENQNEEKDDEEEQEDKVEGGEEIEDKVEKPVQNQDQIEETKEEQDQNQEKEEQEQDEKKQEPDDEIEEGKEEEEQEQQEQDSKEEEEEDDEDVSHYALLAASDLSFPPSSSSPPSLPPPAPKKPSTARRLHPQLVSNQLESGASRYQAYFQFEHSKKHAVSLCPAARTVEEQKLLAASHKEVAHSTRQRAEAATKLSAGRRWFNFESEQVTPEALQDFALLKMRTYLDPKKFYKSWDHASSKPKHFQRGTVLEGPQEFHSNRLTKKQRRKTLTDEIMADQSVVEYTHRVAINIQRAGREKKKKKKRRYN